jgi:hypothetical protein
MNKATKYTLLTIIVGIILFAALTKVAECVPQKPPPKLKPRYAPGTHRMIFIEDRMIVKDSIIDYPTTDTANAQ